MIGPGKYNELGDVLRDVLDADAVLLIVFGGKLGNGTACKAKAEFARQFPNLLRRIANEMERDYKQLDRAAGKRN